jgi:ABC-2 type transport system ATP-binding protein
VHSLSKGNRQKIGLIQAFMHDPELLILDEPTSGLDPLLQKEFADLLEESVSRGRTVFLSSHDLDEVQRLAHQIAIIRDGCLVAVDTVQGLRDKSPRTIELTFRQPIDSSALNRLTGTTVTSATGSRVTLTVDGEVGLVLSTAAAMDVIDIVARPADLDELFRSYYREPEVGAFVR